MLAAIDTMDRTCCNAYSPPQRGRRAQQAGNFALELVRSNPTDCGYQSPGRFRYRLDGRNHLIDTPSVVPFQGDHGRCEYLATFLVV
jgi:hypothetical protein